MGIAERREREKVRRRSGIIKAAEKVFFKNGLDNSTMDMVAEKAELSKATLYLYFKSKEELYFAIFLRGQDKLFKMLDTFIDNEQDVEERIMTFLRTIQEFQKKHPDYFEAFFYFLTNRFNVNKQSEEYISNQEQDKIYLNKWIELVQQGKQENVIRQDLEPIPTVLIIWMQLIGFLKIFSVVESELTEQFSVTKQDMMENYFEIILNGIMKSDG